ncbi:MAG TPA: hypothetical protein VH593_24900 [Ktedonobacteraceae bacterium]|jgi:hypothetical protein
MSEIDKRNRFAKEVFTYRATKDSKILLFWQGKQIMTLKGAKAQKFLEDVDGLDEREAQLVIARITGNFKRGNER